MFFVQISYCRNDVINFKLKNEHLKKNFTSVNLTKILLVIRNLNLYI